MKVAPFWRLVCLSALLLFTTAAWAVSWEDYPGDIDMGGWRIARDSGNHADVVLLGPPGGTVIVGNAADPLTGYVFGPDYIAAQTKGVSGEQYYLIQRAWPTKSQVGDQRIVKLSGPLTLAQLQADPAWSDDEFGDRTFDAPTAPPEAIFWKKPGIVIFYSIIALGPVILLLGAGVIGIIALMIWLRRRKRARAA